MNPSSPHFIPTKFIHIYYLFIPDHIDNTFYPFVIHVLNKCVDEYDKCYYHCSLSRHRFISNMTGVLDDKLVILPTTKGFKSFVVGNTHSHYDCRTSFLIKHVVGDNIVNFV